LPNASRPVLAFRAFEKAFRAKNAAFDAFITLIPAVPVEFGDSIHWSRLGQNHLETTMIPPRFEYHAPKSVSEAVALLGQLGSDAKLLAGGHSLLP
jgi:hypothetical protein